MADADIDIDADAQDLAEVFDETHLTDEKDEFATIEEADDVFDSTEAEGDADDDQALDEADFNLEAVDDDAIENDELEDQPDLFQPEGTDLEDDDEAAAVEERLPADDIEGLDQVADADLVEAGEDDFTNFQSRNLSDEEIDKLGYATKAKPPPHPASGASRKPPRARQRRARSAR